MASGSQQRSRRWRVLQPNDPRPQEAELAVCPGGRSAMVYLLGDEDREPAPARCCARLGELEGVELLAWNEDGEACVWTRRGELRFAPGSARRDAAAGVGRRGLARRRSSSSAATACSTAALIRMRSAGSGRRSRAPARATCCCPPRRATSSWTGAARTTSAAAATARCAAATRSVPLAFVRLRPGPATAARRGERQWSITDVARGGARPLRRRARRRGSDVRRRVVAGAACRGSSSGTRCAAAALARVSTGWVAQPPRRTLEAVFEGAGGGRAPGRASVATGRRRRRRGAEASRARRGAARTRALPAFR